MESPEAARSSEHMFSLFESCVQEAENIALKKNEQGQILAPNGEVSELGHSELLCKIVRTKTFKNWFGDWERDLTNISFAIDQTTREPRLVFHATPADISLEEGLSPNKLRAFIFFIDDHTEALEVWGEGKARATNQPSESIAAYPAFINLRNPQPWGREAFENFYNSHDGILQDQHGLTSYAVKRDDQIMHIPFNATNYPVPKYLR